MSATISYGPSFVPEVKAIGARHYKPAAARSKGYGGSGRMVGYPSLTGCGSVARLGRDPKEHTFYVSTRDSVSGRTIPSKCGLNAAHRDHVRTRRFRLEAAHSSRSRGEGVALPLRLYSGA